jgi:transcriptional regulator with XRE-family HTH domain
MRVSEQLMRTVDNWRRFQSDLPSRAEAIRRLIALGIDLSNRSGTETKPTEQIDDNEYNVPIAASQIRMGRAAVRWGVRELAKNAGVTANTVARIENGADAKQSTMDALQRALKAAGVEFTNGDRPGVRLIRPAERPATWKTAATRPAKTSKKKG